MLAQKASPGRNHCELSGSQDKTCMVNAGLREAQIGDFNRVVA